VVDPDERRLFLTMDGLPFAKLDSLTILVCKYVAQANITKKGGCHLYRHTVATLMLENGADIRFIQEMLGHEDLSSTQVYTHVSIAKLKEHDITVKINTIAIPGINDHHIEEVAQKMAELGADLFNCMAMFPNVDTPFADIPEPSKQQMATLRNKAEKYLPQMRHCTRCRADAVGLLGHDRSEEMHGCLSACASLPVMPKQDRPFVAVATMEGVLVNQHLGEATRFQIWEQKEDGTFNMVEERPASQPGGGPQRWHNLARALRDCRAVLVNDLGDSPKEILAKMGVKPVTMSGFIDMGLEAVYSGKDLSKLKGRQHKCTSKGACSGGGNGCG